MTASRQYLSSTIFVIDRLAEGRLWPSDDDDDDDGAYLEKKGRIQGHILGEITDLEFENHKNVKNVKNVFSGHLNKLRQIYVQWNTKTQIIR